VKKEEAKDEAPAKEGAATEASASDKKEI
jgi:hypothetical protein